MWGQCVPGSAWSIGSAHLGHLLSWIEWRNHREPAGESHVTQHDRRLTDDPAQGLAPVELAGCVLRALALPEVASLRPRLVPELPVYASVATDTHEECPKT